MREVFYEEASFIKNKKTAAFKYNLCLYSAIIVFIIGVFLTITGFVLFSSMLEIILFIVPAIPLFIFGVICLRIKNKRYSEYDYTFVTGSIRFSKVVKEIKRYGIAIFDTTSIINIGRKESLSYKKYEEMLDIKTYNLCANDTPSDNCEFFYIYTIFEGNRTIFLLDCTEKFIAHIMQFANKGILELDKWFI